MSQSQGTTIIVLLGVMLAIAIHVGYVRKPVRHFEYHTTEGERVEFGTLQTLGRDGWDCHVVPVIDGTARRFLTLCKRPIP